MIRIGVDFGGAKIEAAVSTVGALVAAVEGAARIGVGLRGAAWPWEAP